MQKTLPAFLKPVVWWAKFDDLDIEKDKGTIIAHILNTGDTKATDWMKSVYKEQDIKQVLLEKRPGFWDKKSLNFWSLVYGVMPNFNQMRQIK